MQGGRIRALFTNIEAKTFAVWDIETNEIAPLGRFRKASRVPAIKKDEKYCMFKSVCQVLDTASNLWLNVRYLLNV